MCSVRWSIGHYIRGRLGAFPRPIARRAAPVLGSPSPPPPGNAGQSWCGFWRASGRHADDGDILRPREPRVISPAPSGFAATTRATGGTGGGERKRIADRHPIDGLQLHRGYRSRRAESLSGGARAAGAGPVCPPGRTTRGLTQPAGERLENRRTLSRIWGCRRLVSAGPRAHDRSLDGCGRTTCCVWWVQ